MGGKRIWNRTADWLQPLGVNSPALPLVELVGNCRMLIENHRGLIGYSTEQVLIRTKSGMLCVNGTNLTVCKMTDCALVIKGKIRSFEYPQECEP